MGRLGHGRTTPLSREEIAAEVVRQFDTTDTEPSIRSLAAALGVTPRAIYHYYDSRRELIEAALTLVWEEAVAELLSSLADPSHTIDDPVEFFVAAGVAARRAFGRHHRLARYLGLTNEPTPRLAGAVAVIGSLFEAMGLEGEEAGQALHGYLTFVLGSIVLSANRAANGVADDGAGDRVPFSTRELRPADAPDVRVDTVDSIDAVLRSDADDAVLEARFEHGLRRLVRAYLPAETG